MNNLFSELRRRNVFRVAGLYAVVGWLLIQIAVAVLPTFGAPAWVAKTFLALVLAGFPIALIFAWAFELTPDGMKLTSAVPDGETVTGKTGRRLDYVIAGGLALVAVLLAGSWLMPNTKSGGPSGGGGDASVAVLPFVDLSPDGDQEFFSDGISEEILNVLVRIPDLKVAGRTSSFSFKGKNEDLREIGAALDVDHVLEGSVRRSGTKLRITAQLIRSNDGFHLWSETYDREMTDIFDIQDDIAKAVADELAISLGLKSGETLVADRTEDIEAYEKYLKARALFAQRGLENLDAALLLLNEVVARDPDFAPAWSQIAGVYSVYDAYQPTTPPQGDWRQWRAIGTAAAHRAIALHPDNAEAYAYLGTMQIYAGNLIDGFASQDRAVELAPENPAVLNITAQALFTVGYGAEAVDLARRAVAADPLVASHRNVYGYIVGDSGHLAGVESPVAEALIQLETAREYNPTMGYAYANALLILLQERRLDEALAIFRQGQSAGVYPPDDRLRIEEIIDAAKQGEPALRAIKIAELSPLAQNCLYILQDDVDQLVETLMPVWQSDYQVEPLLFSSRVQGLYQDKRWKAEVRRQGLLDLWKSRGFPTQCKPVGKDDFTCE
jgi:adenylate cyclase